MPRKLVIHVGAQKCASSSLQASLRRVESKCPDAFSFSFPSPKSLVEAQALIEKGDESGFQYIDGVLSGLIADQAVVSHETLGNRPGLVCSIAERAIHRHSFAEVVIAGYTRLQSNYHVSAFSQWYFREKRRLQSDIKLFKKQGLDWQKFSALERSLLAVVLSGRVRSWNANYKGILARVRRLGDGVFVVSNHIPTSSRPYSLTRNFFELTGLVVNDDPAQFDVRKNATFHPVILYGLSGFLSEIGMRPTCFPGPHEGNLWLFRLCDRLDSDPSINLQYEDIYDPMFVRKMLEHLDCQALDDNLSYCELMSVEPEYFKPSQEARLFESTEEVIDLVRSISSLRDDAEIRLFSKKVQGLFMDVARAEIIGS
jgi:hypothetical protein